MDRVKRGERVVAGPEILGGKPVMAGMLIAVEAMVGQLRRGQTADDIVRRFGVHHDDVLAASRGGIETCKSR